MSEHHRTKREVAPGIWQVARPLRDSSWWRRLRAERRCRREFGHCWHPMGLVDWWCCMCSGETDGIPPQRCVYCTEERAVSECRGADFSKLLRHLGEQLEAHADRDGLTGVRRAVFLARGWHAPGQLCPTETPADPHEYWCASPDDECNCPAGRRER